MKNRFLKVILVAFNLLLVFLLVLLVNSEFQNADDMGSTSPSNQNEIVILNSEEDSILALLSHEYSDLFNASSLQETYKEEKIDVNNIIMEHESLSNFDIVSSVSGTLCNASGWFFAVDFETDYIVFINDDQQVIGAAVYGTNRKGLSEALGMENADNSGWVGYLNIDSDQAKVHALSKLKGKNEYIELGTFNYERERDEVVEDISVKP